MDGVPGDEGMDMTESYQRLYQACVYGPLDSTRGVPVRAATIPAYVVLNRQLIYTVEPNELPEEAIQHEDDGDWVYYTFRESGSA